MIEIQKGQIPNILAQKSAQWTQELTDQLQQQGRIANSLRDRYNHSEVRSALREEAASKCMYCESKINHIAFDNIEHIRPKSKYPHLTFEWHNLGLACPRCNVNKSDEFDEATPFVNPYQDDPEKHFFASGGFVWHKPGDSRGQLTEHQLQLNRPELFEQRLERINLIRALAASYQNAAESIKPFVHQELMIETGADKAYSMCTRAILAIILAT
jgi:uncharacterized protein (TIGR02646 family)